MHIIRKHHTSFKNAVNGIKWAFSTQPNFKIHFFFSGTALILAFFLGVSMFETIILLLVITLGIATEMLNTSIEAVTDLITTEYNEQARIAKDVSAGIMLTVAIGAVVIACFIFLPKLYYLFL